MDFFELRDWRAIAIAWAVGFSLMIYFGVGWWGPASAIVAGLTARSVWR